MECGDEGPYGAHHPSAATLPWRSSIKPCTASSGWLCSSNASTNAATAAEEIPTASGLVRPSCIALGMLATYTFLLVEPRHDFFSVQYNLST
jgi:hypothetical protein